MTTPPVQYCVRAPGGSGNVVNAPLIYVGHGVDAALDMGDVVIFKAAQHVDDGIHLADVGEKLIAKAFAFGRTAHEAGDIDE